MSPGRLSHDTGWGHAFLLERPGHPTQAVAESLPGPESEAEGQPVGPRKLSCRPASPRWRPPSVPLGGPVLHWLPPRRSRVSLMPGSGPAAYWPRREGLGAGGGSPKHTRRGAQAAPLCPTPPPASPPQPKARRPAAGAAPRARGLREGAAPLSARGRFQTAAARAPSSGPAERDGLFRRPRRPARYSPPSQPLRPGGRRSRASLAQSARGREAGSCRALEARLVPAAPYERPARMLRACSVRARTNPDRAVARPPKRSSSGAIG